MQVPGPVACIWGLNTAHSLCCRLSQSATVLSNLCVHEISQNLTLTVAVLWKKTLVLMQLVVGHALGNRNIAD